VQHMRAPRLLDDLPGDLVERHRRVVGVKARLLG
jgi:hypothetical protein